MLMPTAAATTSALRSKVRGHPRGSVDEIAFGVGQDHVAHGLVIFDVAGAAAEVAVERLGDQAFEAVARHRRFRQPLEQDLALVQEAGGAVAALEREVLDEGLLQRRTVRRSWRGLRRCGSSCRRKLAADTTQVGLVWLVPSGLSTMTAQLRHCAAPQPNLVPVMPRYSRRKSFMREIVAHLGRARGPVR